MNKIGLVIDNTSVFLEDEYIENNIFSIIELKTYTDDGKEIQKDFDNDYDKYYKYLEDNKQFGKTSTDSLGNIKIKLEIALEKCEKIIVLTTMSNVSSTYNNTVIASKEFDDRVEVVDTCSVVGATYFLVEYANELINLNIEFKEIANKLRVKAKKSITYILISSFDALVKNGRIGKAKSQVASLLNIKAIVSLNHEGVKIDSKFRTYKKAIKYLSNIINDQMDKKYNLITGNIMNDDLENQLKNSIEDMDINLKLVSIPPIIGLHGGVGLLGISLMNK